VRHLGEAALQGGDVLRLQAVDRQADRLRLEGDAHHHQLLDIGRRDRLHGHAPVRLSVDETFALEHAQRLAQRRAADTELVGERDLRHHGSRPDVSLEDRLPHPPVDLLDIVPAPVRALTGHAPERTPPSRRHLLRFPS